ncbi:MAG: helix-turn-helix domain-containing protein, partial [Bradyrhizobium sp.]
MKQFKQPDSGGDLVSVLKAVLMSRRDIANYLALTIETVARVMSHLRELGMICFPQNPQTLVLDKTRLRELVFEHERSRAKKLY